MGFKTICTCVTTTQNKIQNQWSLQKYHPCKRKHESYAKPMPRPTPLPFQSICHPSFAPAWCHPSHPWHPFGTIPQLQNIPSHSLWLNGTGYLAGVLVLFLRWHWATNLLQTQVGGSKANCPCILALAAGPTPPDLLPWGLRVVELSGLWVVINRDNQVMWSS